MLFHSRSACCLALVPLLFAPAFVLGAGPIAVNPANVPYHWPGGGRIVYHTDQGSLGTMTNAEATAQTDAAFARWGAVATATAVYSNAGQLPFDVDETNFFPFLFVGAPDGLSPIVYDDQGEIFTFLFGGSAEFILGFAGPEIVDAATGEILEGLSFLNGLPLVSTLFPFTVEDMFTVQVHEFGHYSGLGHTVVNGQVFVFGDASGPSPHDTFPVDFATLPLETMYPFLLPAGGLHADDRASLSRIYPRSDYFATTGSISGTIRDEGGVPLTGINVMARNLTNPFDDAVSAISSDFAFDFTPGAPGVGEYTITGLTPGAQYAVYVDQIRAGGFSTPRGVLPGPEEFYNGANETHDTTDIASEFTPIPVTAGVTVTGIDIHLVSFPPGPLPLVDESAIDLPIGFEFEFCGKKYTRVGIHDNGFLMFGGTQQVSFIITVEDFLGRLPRIAPLWSDLNPDAGGVIAYNRTRSRFSVTYTGVPEWPNQGSNTFKVTLKKDGEFLFNYGAFDAFGIAGFSCGGERTTGLETPSDLSRLAPEIETREPAIYEMFERAANDLAGRVIEWEVEIEALMEGARARRDGDILGWSGAK